MVASKSSAGASGCSSVGACHAMVSFEVGMANVSRFVRMPSCGGSGVT